MSRLICIMGESGSGKTTSMRNLPPKETVYIDCDGKGLAWKGWRNDYNGANQNYFKTTDPLRIQENLLKISAEWPHIKYIVIDTINAVMIAYEFAQMRNKSYDKWMDLASSVYYIVTDSNRLRDDLTVILIAHSETVMDDVGYMFTRIKTNGRKLNKIVLESYMPTVLLAKRKDDGYVFETQANNSTAKSPMGAFDSFEVPNDIMEIIRGLEEF